MLESNADLLVSQDIRRIQYIDYRTAHPHLNDIAGPLCYKRHAFSFEQEIRVIRQELPTVPRPRDGQLDGRAIMIGPPLDAIDLARATWNLALNRGKDWRISSGRPRPVNDILLCPFHTMHNEDGSLATESWWYDPGYSEPAQQFTDRAKIDRLFTFSKKLRTRLSQSAYSDELSNSLVRYVRALDAADLNDAFLRLWSILEFLTDSTFDPYKVAIRRAAFMFSERDYSVQVLTLTVSNLTEPCDNEPFHIEGRMQWEIWRNSNIILSTCNYSGTAEIIFQL